MAPKIELNVAELSFMIVGDFLGLVFLFLILFWVCDNVKACRTKVDTVDKYIRRKSSSLVSSRWSLRSKGRSEDEGYNSKAGSVKSVPPAVDPDGEDESDYHQDSASSDKDFDDEPESCSVTPRRNSILQRSPSAKSHVSPTTLWSYCCWWLSLQSSKTVSFHPDPFDAMERGRGSLQITDRRGRYLSDLSSKDFNRRHSHSPDGSVDPGNGIKLTNFRRLDSLTEVSEQTTIQSTAWLVYKIDLIYQRGCETHTLVVPSSHCWHFRQILACVEAMLI